MLSTLARQRLTPVFFGLLLAFASAAPAATAQVVEHGASLDRVSHVVIPQRHGFSLSHQHRGIAITGVKADISILEQTAKTTLDIALRNTGTRRAEAVILLPVASGSVVSEFFFEGASAEPTARILPLDEARRLYDSIVARVRDPALLEFAGYNLIRTSVFPVEAGGTQRVRLTYENLLEAHGNRIDYVLPRSEALDARVPWEINVSIQAKAPISMVYSPSHDISTTRDEARRVRTTLNEAARDEPGSFFLSYLLERDDVSASLFAYPDPSVGGGYFLLMAGLPASLEDAANLQKREVTIVIDTSGSMAGGKIAQVRDAASQLIAGLEEGEAFNIIRYSTTVTKFSSAPVIKSPETEAQAHEFLGRMRAGGGTNIHDALLEALRQKPTRDMLPIVLFLTDGLPTVGKTSEPAIRGMVDTVNVHERRVFTFGVGHDVNAPLLDRIADLSRGKTSYVDPDEDVEVKVAHTFKQLHGPVLADISVAALDANGAGTTRALTELIPQSIPDLFEGDQLILLGQYTKEDPITFRIAGDFLGTKRVFTFDFDFDQATTRNAFVPRLWASRRIAYLIDQIRQAGANFVGTPHQVSASMFADERFRELTDEILRLSTEFGILTEYTAFLATEGTDLGDWNRMIEACSFELDSKAVRTRSGQAAVNQSWNYNAQKGQATLNRGNTFWNDKFERVAITNVQQVCDRAFFHDGSKWVDSRLISRNANEATTGDEPTIEPDRIVEYGSEAHIELLHKLIREGRQGMLSLNDDILLIDGSERILVRNTSQDS